MFNITHQLFIKSQVSVTEQQTNSWRYNKPLCRTPSWHKTIQTDSAHYTLSHIHFRQTHQLRTSCNSLYAVYEWNYSTGTAKLCNCVKKNPTWCTTYSRYILSTSTCFGLIKALHQEVQPYVHNPIHLGQ